MKTAISSLIRKLPAAALLLVLAGGLQAAAPLPQMLPEAASAQ